MKTILLTLVTGVLIGCATPFRSPPDLAHVALVRADSPSVVVEKIWLERKHGPLVVTGYVVRQRGVTETTGTHLDIILYDAAGNILRRDVAYFEPRQIPHVVGRPGSFSSYRVPLDPFPANTARVEVRADDQPHHGPS